MLCLAVSDGAGFQNTDVLFCAWSKARRDNLESAVAVAVVAVLSPVRSILMYLRYLYYRVATVASVVQVLVVNEPFCIPSEASVCAPTGVPLSALTVRSAADVARIHFTVREGSTAFLNPWTALCKPIVGPVCDWVPLIRTSETFAKGGPLHVVA